MRQRRNKERSKKLPFSQKVVNALAIVVVFRGFQVSYEVKNVLVVLKDLDIQDAPYIDARETIEDESKWWRGQGQDQNASHPHLGVQVTTNETSMFQMIVDPSPDRLREPQKDPKFGIDPDILCPAETFGIETEERKEALLKINNGIKKYNDRVSERKRKSKILCMIYTADVPSSRTSLTAQADTWGQKCDGFFAASNITDHSNGSIDLVHHGPESYQNMWQKVRSMWAYAYDHYLNDYDFFHIAGDDVYVVMENLRAFLDGPHVLALENGHLDEIQAHPEFIENAKKWLNASDNPQDDNYGILGRPLWFGQPCRFRLIFPCGGPGYTLNRAALEVVGRLRLDSFLANNIDPREDLFIGSLFASLGIPISHPSNDVGYLYGESPPNDGGSPGDIKVTMAYGLKPFRTNEGICSMHLKNNKKRLIANNRTMADLMYRYHAILYDLCDDEQHE